MRRSIATNSASAASASARQPSVCAEPQPTASARTSAKVATAAATVKAAPPAQSIRRPGAGRLSLSVRRAITTAATAIGTLTKKTQRHDSASVSSPPTIGPAAAAAPLVAPQMPKAVPSAGPR